MLVCFASNGVCAMADSHPRTQCRKYPSFSPKNACWCRFNNAVDLAAHMIQLFGAHARMDMMRLALEVEV